MKLSVIKEKVDSFGDPRAMALIEEFDDCVKGFFIFTKDGKKKRKSFKYKTIEFDVCVNESNTILQWDRKDSWTSKYINYYDRREK